MERMTSVRWDGMADSKTIIKPSNSKIKNPAKKGRTC